MHSWPFLGVAHYSHSSFSSPRALYLLRRGKRKIPLPPVRGGKGPVSFGSELVKSISSGLAASLPPPCTDVGQGCHSAYDSTRCHTSISHISARILRCLLSSSSNTATCSKNSSRWAHLHPPHPPLKSHPRGTFRCWRLHAAQTQGSSVCALVSPKGDCSASIWFLPST